jgi:hypothetical protein
MERFFRHLHSLSIMYMQPEDYRCEAGISDMQGNFRCVSVSIMPTGPRRVPADGQKVGMPGRTIIGPREEG